MDKREVKCILLIKIQRKLCNAGRNSPNIHHNAIDEANSFVYFVIDCSYYKVAVQTATQTYFNL